MANVAAPRHRTGLDEHQVGERGLGQHVPQPGQRGRGEHLPVSRHGGDIGEPRRTVHVPASSSECGHDRNLPHHCPAAVRSPATPARISLISLFPSLCGPGHLCSFPRIAAIPSCSRAPSWPPFLFRPLVVTSTSSLGALIPGIRRPDHSPAPSVGSPVPAGRWRGRPKPAVTKLYGSAPAGIRRL